MFYIILYRCYFFSRFLLNKIKLTNSPFEYIAIMRTLPQITLKMIVGRGVEKWYAKIVINLSQHV